MIDSTTIKFAISKFDSLTAQVMPHLKEGGMALVDYKVLERVLNWSIEGVLCFLIFLVSLYFFKKFYKIGLALKWGDGPYIPGVLFGGTIAIVSGVLFIIFLFNIPSIVLAIKHPVIFTILDLAGK